MTVSRRSFLTMLGVSAIAPALPSIPAFNAPLSSVEKEIAHTGGLRFTERARNAMAAAIVEQCTYLMCTDSAGSPVGPLYALPAEFWHVSKGVASFRAPITIVDWDGPTCTLAGIAIMDMEGRQLFKVNEAFNQMPVMAGDSVSLLNLSVAPS